MDSINRMAIELIDEAIDFADELRIEPYELDSGATARDREGTIRFISWRP